MIVRFVPEARSELHDGASYYEGELSGLGVRFWEEVDQHSAWISENAEVPRLRSGGYGVPAFEVLHRQLAHQLNKSYCGDAFAFGPRFRAAVNEIALLYLERFSCNVKAARERRR